jgi:uncharacterized membrane protein YkoI
MATPEPAAPAPVAPAAPTYPVTPDQAIAAALAAAPGATLAGTPELVSYQGTPAFEVPLNWGMVYINATTGTVLHNGAPAPTATPSPSPTPRPLIGEKEAAEIARAYLKGGTVATVTLTNERGVVVYDVTFTNGSKVYVNAYTGEVVYAKVAPGKSSKPSKPRQPDGEDDDHDD